MKTEAMKSSDMTSTGTGPLWEYNIGCHKRGCWTLNIDELWALTP